MAVASLTYGPDEPRAPALAIVLSLFLHIGSHMLLIPLELKSGLSFLSPNFWALQGPHPVPMSGTTLLGGFGMLTAAWFESWLCNLLVL